jgi:hypothetical protein
MLVKINKSFTCTQVYNCCKDFYSIWCYIRNTSQLSVSRHGNTVEWAKQFVKCSSFLKAGFSPILVLLPWRQRKVDLHDFHLSFLPSVGTVRRTVSFSSRAVPADDIGSLVNIYAERDALYVCLYVLGRLPVLITFIHERAIFQWLPNLCSWQSTWLDVHGAVCVTSRKLDSYAIILTRNTIMVTFITHGPGRLDVLREECNIYKTVFRTLRCVNQKNTATDQWGKIGILRKYNLK